MLIVPRMISDQVLLWVSQPPSAPVAAEGTVLVGFAEFERELTAVRTAEGRRRAKARGKCMGRCPCPP